ncbi:MAG: hypothetical protein ACXQTB_01770 [Candidatus Nezhaarchaeales archaeon]
MPNEKSGEELIETLKLCNAPIDVLEKLRKIILEHLREGKTHFTASIDVKVYRPPKNVNKMVFRAVADEYVQGASLHDIWRFVNQYYTHASKFDKSLEYKGWETYVSREVFKLIEMGYATTNEIDLLREIVRSRKKMKRFRDLWSRYADKIIVKPIPEAIRKLPSRPSKKKVEIKVNGKEALIKGLYGRRLRIKL